MKTPAWAGSFPSPAYAGGSPSVAEGDPGRGSGIGKALSVWETGRMRGDNTDDV